MKVALALAVGLAVAGLALQPSAQPAPEAVVPVADCGPVQGTVPVSGDDQVMAGMARVSADDAGAGALRAVPGATVTEVELDEEDGFLVYEVDLDLDRVEHEVVVDAGTGEVLCTEQD